jgi:hypothetical protein
MRTGLAIALALAGCGDNLEALGPLTGMHRIDVPHPDGSLDHVYLAVAQPVGAGPFPTVVFARGQNINDFANCDPTTYPSIGVTADLVVDLAEHGYLAIGVLYRNVGDGEPGLGTLTLRDLHLRDARAILDAARWARANSGAAPTALFATSNGVFPTLWAIADPTLDRSGLDLRTAILSGQSGNWLATLASLGASFASSDAVDVKAAVFYSSILALQVHAGQLDLPNVSEAVIDPGTPFGDRLSGSITPLGRELVRQLAFERASNQVPLSCALIDDVPPICDTTCLNDVILSSADVVPGDLLLPQLTDAMTFWQPPGSVDPGPAPANPVIDYLRAVSPAYTLTGPLAVGRVMIMASANDNVLADPGPIALDQLRARLTATGVTLVPEPAIDRDDNGDCQRGDYIDTTRPRCGYQALLDELATAIR